MEHGSGQSRKMDLIPEVQLQVNYINANYETGKNCKMTPKKPPIPSLRKPQTNQPDNKAINH